MTDTPAAAVTAAADVLENDNWSKGSEELARAVLEAAAPHITAAERQRIRHAMFACQDCGKIHEARSVPPRKPGEAPGITWASPDDGHAYRPPLSRLDPRVRQVAQAAGLLEGTP